MHLLILTAIIATVAPSPLTQSKIWPWQVGEEYIYDVETYSWTKFDNSDSVGNAFKAQFVIRMLAPGQLIAKLCQPFYAKIQVKTITYRVLPSDLKFRPIYITDEPFEISVDGGRIKSFNVPDTLSVAHENLVKGLLSALQADISTFGHVDTFPNSFDKETFQGLFKKMETDVTGECETLYTISPLSAEWHRELPKFASVEDPVEIIKGKNYDSCKNRFTSYSGVPEGAIWKGIAFENGEKQFIKQFFESRLIAGKQGTIFKSEVISSVFVSPLLYGKQKAEVYSYVKALLSSVGDISGDDWEKPEISRQIDSLLFSVSEYMFVPKSNDKTISDALTLLQEMAPLLQTPNKLVKADFFSKFKVLLRLIVSLSSEQLTEMTSRVNVLESTMNVTKAGIWIIYRDAVAQAGTIAAFREIKSWILAKKIYGEEAAELITSIGVTVNQPSTDFQSEFFDFTISPEVTEQQYLNSSALLSATKMFRTNKKFSYVTRHVIPYISKQLKKAVANGDSNKAQVYVRALGNLAHEAVLEAFAPYLEGRIGVTKYLRIQMVASLKNLANLKNKSVRALLFSILRNTAEHYEVRVLAALNIFMAFPTAEMMYVMARMTNSDPSMQVRAVLANGIKFAAELKDPRFTELAKTARFVKNFVTKETFGYHISTDILFDEYTSDDDIAFFAELSTVGSEDSFLPLYHRSALRDRGTGWTEESQAVRSSPGQLVINKPKVDFYFPAEEVAKSLKIERHPRDPLQGALFIEILNQQKLITFNEEDLKEYINSILLLSNAQLIKGVKVQHTKLLIYHKHTYVRFPLAAGVPFIFEYSEPFMYSVNGQVKYIKSSQHADYLKVNFDITIARNLDGNVGFLDTLDNVYASVGVINKVQFYFPTIMNIGVPIHLIKLNLELPKQDTTFIHMSVWPYTAQQKIDCIQTISKHPLTKYIERPAKVVSADLKIGSLHLEGFSHSSDFINFNDLYDSDFLTNIGNLMSQKDVALTQFDLKYIATETKYQDITLSAFIERLYNQKHGGKMGPAATKNGFADKTVRRKEIVRDAAAGIESAEVYLFDFSAVCNGEQNVEYVFTMALAGSYVDNKVQGVFFFNGSEQVNLVFKMVKPKIVSFNFEEALKNKITETYEVDFKFGNNENIRLQGYGERSEKYTKELSKAKRCLQETSSYNLYQTDCYKMIIKAHTPDYFNLTVTYKDFNLEYLKIARNTYEKMFKKMVSWEPLDVVTNTIDDDKLEIEVQSFYYDHYVNYKFKSKYGMFRLNNVESLGYQPYDMAVYAHIIEENIFPIERLFKFYYGFQYLPYCAVDNGNIWTFSGRSYNYSLTSSWHVVMVDESNIFDEWTDMVILARRPKYHKYLEVYISYTYWNGEYVELHINPSAVEVKSNTAKVSRGALTVYWEEHGFPLLQYYTLADGVQVFDIIDGAMHVMYDKQRLVIITADYHTTTGICGQSSSQNRDFMTPYGLVNEPELYGASYSLENECSDPRTVEMKVEAQLTAYQPVIKYTNVLRSDAEWSMIADKYSNYLSEHHETIYNHTFSNGA